MIGKQLWVSLFVSFYHFFVFSRRNSFKVNNKRRRSGRNDVTQHDVYCSMWGALAHVILLE